MPRSSVLPRRARRLAVAALALAAACTTEQGGPPKVGVPDPTQATYAPALGVQLAAFYKTPGGVYYLDTQVGTGTVAITGRRVSAHYTGWLPDGTKFDSSRDRGEPYTFTLGAGDVIRGWDEGINGMKVGGRRKLVIPAALAYGSNPPGGDIPPDATLVFEVELVAVP